MGKSGLILSPSPEGLRKVNSRDRSPNQMKLCQAENNMGDCIENTRNTEHSGGFRGGARPAPPPLNYICRIPFFGILTDSRLCVFGAHMGSRAPPPLDPPLEHHYVNLKNIMGQTPNQCQVNTKTDKMGEFSYIKTYTKKNILKNGP